MSRNADSWPASGNRRTCTTIFTVHRLPSPLSPRRAPDPDVRRRSSVVHTLHVHLVLLTKYRRDVLNDPRARPIQADHGDVSAKLGADLRGAELPNVHGEHDHIHLLAHWGDLSSANGLIGAKHAKVSSRAGMERAGIPL
ncbi:transposase [Micromonospora sp. NPDC051296]|uniref:transposase n=1 Tax=Micromonospora sp. NPDC051296 TaxID=3155046 RepID=UPI003428056E